MNCASFAGGHGTHRHLAALADEEDLDGDHEAGERAAMKPKGPSIIDVSQFS